jgi:phage repressor protein C with HTH and peptisase S24 domain
MATMSRDPIEDLRRANLRRWMEERSVTNKSLAQRLEASESTVSLLFKSHRPFSEKTARKIEKTMFMPTGYLDQKEEKMEPIDVWDRPEDLPEGVYALVPRIGVRLSAGQGIEAIEESELPPLAFRESWLKRKHVSSRKNLRVLEVHGESMEPYLQDGDVVLVDLGQRDVVDGEVYALAYGDELRIKRLSKRFDGGLIIRSDNPRFPEETVTASDLQHIRVLGRHIWRGG